MVFSSKKIIKYAVMGMISILQLNALEKPCSMNFFEREKAIHDCWAIKQFTDKQFPAGFPIELTDRIAQTELEISNPNCPTFKTAEDISDFDKALSNLKQFNEVKVVINLSGKTYFLDKTEAIVQLLEGSGTFMWGDLYYRHYFVSINNAKLVDSKVMESPKRVQCFYDIDVINQNLFNVADSKKEQFKNVKMTVLMD